MKIKDLISNLGEKQKERKELIERLDQQIRIQKIVEDRQKSANQRELERYLDEDREESIKEQLTRMRKKRDNDIRFNHNPLNVKNITNSTEWEVLKERNMFKGNKNMFSNNKFIHKSNNKLLNSERLFSI